MFDRRLNDGRHHLVLQGLDHAAPEHYHLWVEYVDEISDCDADIFGCLRDDPVDELIAPPDRFPKITAAQVFQAGAEHLREDRLLSVFDGRVNVLENRGPTGECLETSLVAAGAFGAVHVDNH